MMRHSGGRRLALVTLIAALCAACLDPTGSSRRDVVVGVAVPASIPAIGTGVLRLSHFAYDPDLQDGPATLVGADSVRFTHVPGVQDVFLLRSRGRVPAGMKTYITVRGYEIAAECVRYVLWDGISNINDIPASITMQPVAPACER